MNDKPTITLELTEFEAKAVRSAVRKSLVNRIRQVTKKPDLPGSSHFKDFRYLIIENCESVLRKLEPQLPHKGSNNDEHAHQPNGAEIP